MGICKSVDNKETKTNNKKETSEIKESDLSKKSKSTSSNISHKFKPISKQSKLDGNIFII